MLGGNSARSALGGKSVGRLLGLPGAQGAGVIPIERDNDIIPAVVSPISSASFAASLVRWVCAPNSFCGSTTVQWCPGFNVSKMAVSVRSPDPCWPCCVLSCRFVARNSPPSANSRLAPVRWSRSS
jgi:hypothetical protein